MSSSPVSDRTEIMQARQSPSDLAAAAGFDGQSRHELARGAGAMSTIAREEGEIKAAMVLARQMPRNEADAYASIIKACQRPSFAEGAMYIFPRGDSNIEGPSVDMARELARVWGNIRYGLRIVTLDEDDVHIKGFAFDIQTNTYVEAEDKFARLIQRKGKGWIKPDERDLRELINRRGAICVRNAILQLIPPDIVDDAVREVKTTKHKSANGEIKQDRVDAIRRLTVAFGEFGVTAENIQDYLCHDIFMLTPDELSDLRAVYRSIRDGNSTPAEHFGGEKKAKQADVPGLRAKVRELHDALANAGDGVAAASALAKVGLPLPQIAECKDADKLGRAIDALTAAKQKDSAGQAPNAGETPSGTAPAVGGGASHAVVDVPAALNEARSEVRSLYEAVTKLDSGAATDALGTFQLNFSDVPACVDLALLNRVIAALNEAKQKLAPEASKQCDQKAASNVTTGDSLLPDSGKPQPRGNTRR